VERRRDVDVRIAPARIEIGARDTAAQDHAVRYSRCVDLISQPSCVVRRAIEIADDVEPPWLIVQAGQRLDEVVIALPLYHGADRQQ
jgi:hypothetical protein